MHRTIIGIAFVLILVGCTNTKPQRPRMLGEQRIDTAMLKMLDMNQRMASEADLRLSQYVEQGYVQMDLNYWVKGLTAEPNDGTDTIGNSEYIDLQATFYTLSDSLLTVHNAQCMMGKVDEIQAIADVVSKMHRGQQISMIVPWYLAFGSAGNTEVQPYENVRVELIIK